MVRVGNSSLDSARDKWLALFTPNVVEGSVAEGNGPSTPLSAFGETSPFRLRRDFACGRAGGGINEPVEPSTLK